MGGPVRLRRSGSTAGERSCPAGPQRHRLPRGPGRRGTDRDPAAATLLVRCLAAARRRLSKAQRAHRGRRAAGPAAQPGPGRVGVQGDQDRSAAPTGDPADPARSTGRISRRSAESGPAAGGANQHGRRLLDLPPGARANGRSTTSPPDGLRPAAVRGRLLVQGGLPRRLRLPDRATSARRSSTPAPADRLPGEGLRELPRADARPAGARSCPTGRSAIRPTWRSPWSSCWPTSATSSATTRTRSRPRRTSGPLAGASRSGGTPGSSTTSCTTAATPAPGSRSRSTGMAAPTARRSRPARGSSVATAARVRPCRRPSSTRRWPRTRWCSRRSIPSRPCWRRNRIQFHTWGDLRCCLPVGSHPGHAARDARAQLQLRAGDVLIFEEVLGPSGRAVDADPDALPGRPPRPRPGRRAPTRSTAPPCSRSPGTRRTPSGSRSACRSSRTAPGVTGASVARGNVVLADHGLSDPGAPRAAGRRSRSSEHRRRTGPGCSGGPDVPDAVRPRRGAQAPGRDAIAVRSRGVAGAGHQPLATGAISGRRAATCSPATGSRPSSSSRWSPTGAPTSASATTSSVVARRAAPCSRRRTASAAVVPATSGRRRSRGWSRTWTGSTRSETRCPRSGGEDPEPIEQVRQFAPQAFRTQERAVTEADYAEVAQRRRPSSAPPRRDAGRAAGTRSSSRSTAAAGSPSIARFRTDMAGVPRAVPDGRHRRRDRRAHVRPARHRADRLRRSRATSGADVKAELLRRFGNGRLPDGAPGFFHPDNFTFGQPVYLSRVVAAAMEVEGVSWVDTSHEPGSAEPVRPLGPASAGGVRRGCHQDGPARDRPARQRPERARERPHRLPHGGRAVSPRRASAGRSTAAAAARRASTCPTISNPPGHVAIGYRIGTHATFLARMLAAPAGRPVSAGRRRPEPPAAPRGADHAIRRRPGDRPPRRLGDGRGRPDLLPGADRERGIPPHVDRAALDPRAGALHRLRAPARRRGGRLSHVHRRDRRRGAATAPWSSAGTKVRSIPGQDERPQTFETTVGHHGACRVERAAAAPHRAAADRTRPDAASASPG